MMEKEILFQNQVVRLKISAQFRPVWLDREEQIPIFLARAWRLPAQGELLASFSFGAQDYPAALRTENGIEFAFDCEQAIADIRQEAYLPDKRPLSSRFPISYQMVPANLRILLAKAFYQKQRLGGKTSFPQWPVDKSLEVLDYLNNLPKRMSAVWLWPGRKSYAFVATHDLETRQGFEDFELLMKINNDFAVRPCVNVPVRLMEAYPDKINRIKQTNCTIGCHGYNHDNKLAFLPREKMRSRLERCAQYLSEHRIKGFRSPSLLRSQQLIAELKNYFLFDSSYPDTDCFSETGRANGCCSIRPFYLQGLLELPITLAMDSSLLFMGYDHEQMLEVWLKKLAWIKQRGGMALINIHCHRPFSLGTRVYQSYGRLLEVVAKDEQCWCATPEEIAAHWHGVIREG